MKLEEKLISLRKKSGQTQLQVADALGVSRQAISKWEAGNAIPSSENLKRIGKLYGVSADFLLQENVEDFAQREQYIEGEEKKLQTRMVLSHKTIAVAAVFVVIIIGITVAVGAIFENHKNIGFSEMGSDQWEISDSEGFSIEPK